MTHGPLIVTAELANGYASADPWSPGLDGILAYWALREQLGEEEFALGMTGHRSLVEPDLPLARDGDDARWWWVCSSPEAVGVAARFVRWEHRRFDLDAATRHVEERVRSVLVGGGPYKNYRNRRLGVVCRALTWRCVGEAREIERLLRRCDNIGAGHTHGWGVVRRWRVEPGAAEDGERARNDRPLPVEIAAARGVFGPQWEWGIRPPGRAPEHRALCVMPERG